LIKKSNLKECICLPFLTKESDVCQRMNCPSTRGFVLHIVDCTNQV